MGGSQALLTFFFVFREFSPSHSSHRDPVILRPPGLALDFFPPPAGFTGNKDEKQPQWFRKEQRESAKLCSVMSQGASPTG